MKPKVIVTRRWPALVEEKLASRFDVCVNEDDRPFSVSDLRDALQHYDALLTTVTDTLDASVLQPLETDSIRTRIIGNFGVGYSHIDINAANSHGIVVSNTPDVLSECTADIAMMLVLMVARRAGEGERELRSHQWSGWRPTHLIGNKVSGATLGIVGLGRIGREMACRAKGFGMQIKVYNRSPVKKSVLAQFNAVQLETLDELMVCSDFISLHCPGGDENTHLISRERLTMMRSNAYLINTARGEVVDERALIEHLRAGKIAGAGLDVFQNEPQLNADFYDCPNVVLLPHIGSATESTRVAMGMRVLGNLEEFFGGGQPTDLVYP